MTTNLTEDPEQLCHCDLSGELCVVNNKTCCEVCVAEARHPINAETMKNVLRYFDALIHRS